jgi:hypothetical protein
LLVTKVNGAGATLILTSIRAPGGQVLSIKVERLEARAQVPSAGIRTPASPAAPAPAAPATASGLATTVASHSDSTSTGYVPIQIRAHVRSRGDMKFVDVAWAGRVAPGLWLESFAVRPLERLTPADIEYKALTATGFETPWHSDEKMCGTKGMSVALVGFAVRLKAGPTAAAYECEYSGYFQSGQVVGPMRNGAPCRSTLANDPIEGIQVRLLRRAGRAQNPSAPIVKLRPVDVSRGRASLPRARKRSGKKTRGSARKALVRAAPSRRPVKHSKRKRQPKRTSRP